IAGWGIAVDAVVSDFVAGAAERLVVEGHERGGDLLWVEGQGSILHPVYSGVTLGLFHGSAPHLLVLCHEVGRTEVEGAGGGPHPLPPLAEWVELHERMSLRARPSRVACIALNTRFVSEDGARAAIAAAEAETGLPADDPVRFGGARLADDDQGPGLPRPDDPGSAGSQRPDPLRELPEARADGADDARRGERVLRLRGAGHEDLPLRAQGDHRERAQPASLLAADLNARR